MYRVSTPGKVSIRIYSLDGKLVKEITKDRNEGIYEELWDMRDNSGTELPSGIYLIHYSACGEKIKAVEKIVYIR
jgi:flagellar hook assembly protein FlgD